MGINFPLGGQPGDGAQSEHGQIAHAQIRCGNCGCLVRTRGGGIKRGAIVVLTDPRRVMWRRKHVPLSPTELAMFEVVARDGRATFADIDQAIVANGTRLENRSVHLYRIRQKFMLLGAANPLVRRSHGLVLNLQPDENGSIEVCDGIDEVDYLAGW